MPPVTHAVLSASSAARWLSCPPSARLCERLDARFGAKSSSYAEEGTKAHALGELKLRYAIYKADKMTAARHGEMTPTEREAYPGINVNRYKALRKELGDIPADMEKATDSYCDVVMERWLRARKDDPSVQLFLEQHLDFSEWVPSGFGTGDAIIVGTTLLDVIDYKHGVGVPVDAEGNPQMRLYALGAYARFGAIYEFPQVRCTIVQPRLDRLSVEYISTEDLLNWATNVVAPVAKIAWEGKGDFMPSEKACRFCSAKAVCAARAAQALKVYDFGLAGSGELSHEQIEALYPLLNDAEAWIQDIREYVITTALNGERYKGYKLVAGRKPNRKWTDENRVREELLRSGYGPETYEKTLLKSPSDISKALGAAAFRSIIEANGLVSQGEAKPILVKEDDPRPEINSADAAFEDMATETVQTEKE